MADATIAMIEYVDHTGVTSARLGSMARQAFSDTFAHLYEREPFEEFLHAAYGPGGTMERDLKDPAIHWKIAVVDEEPIGYAKVSAVTVPAPEPEPDALELRQIYVLSAWHGKGVADTLMEWALDCARSFGATEMYLAVFNHNERAKRFYAKYGFSEVGRCTFTVGKQVDDDRVWRKVL